MEIQDLYINSARLSKAVDVQFKRYLYDLMDWNVRMLCIRGARGVGKTTMMLQYIKLNNLRATQALYCSLDDLWFTDHRLLDLADYHFTHGGTHLFIDEVHRYPFRTWSQELKNIYDRYPGLNIIFSGSSMLQLDQSSADLSRRCIFYDMQGLSFREYLMLEHHLALPKLSLAQLLTSHETITLDITAETKILPLFTEYLRHGYYPFYRETRQSYAKAIQQVITNIIDTDLPAVENIEYITATKMKRLFVILSRMVPFTINLTDLGRQIEASRQAVLRMCHLLQQSGLIIMLYGLFEMAGKARKTPIVGEMLHGCGDMVFALGAATTLVGFALGTFFGLSLVNYVPEGTALHSYYEFVGGNFPGTTYSFQMASAILIGVVHLCIALMVKAIIFTQKEGLSATLSMWAWNLLLIGGVIVGTLYMVGTLSAEATRMTVIAIGAVSAVGIYFLNNVGRLKSSPLKGLLINPLAGLYETYNMASGLLGDVLSYVRLYALCLAGGALGSAFNQIGDMVVEKAGVAFLWGAIIIYVIGHLLNLLLSAISAFVHPLRLNFVEYFKNSGYEGKGTGYAPLKNA